MSRQAERLAPMPAEFANPVTLLAFGFTAIVVPHQRERTYQKRLRALLPLPCTAEFVRAMFSEIRLVTLR